MTINGKQVQLYAGMVCVDVFIQKAADYPKAGAVMTTASILYGGILNYCLKKELDVPVTFEEVYEEVENKSIQGDDFIEAQEFMKTFTNSLAFKKKVEDIDKANEEIKKKLATDSLPTNVDLAPESTTE